MLVSEGIFKEAFDRRNKEKVVLNFPDFILLLSFMLFSSLLEFSVFGIEPALFLTF